MNECSKPQPTKELAWHRSRCPWLLHKDLAATPIIETTIVDHLREAVEVLGISLSDNDLAYLEEPYEPVEPARW